MTTPKRRILSFVFAVLCLKKSLDTNHLSSGSLRKVIIKENFKLLAKYSDYSQMFWLKNFWYFGKLVAEQSWSQLEKKNVAESEVAEGEMGLGLSQPETVFTLFTGYADMPYLAILAPVLDKCQISIVQSEDTVKSSKVKSAWSGKFPDWNTKNFWEKQCQLWGITR